jgi:hypothetical protein
MNQDRAVCQRGMRPELATQFTTIHQRHHPVRNDQIGRLAKGMRERLDAAV